MKKYLETIMTTIDDDDIDGFGGFGGWDQSGSRSS